MENIRIQDLKLCIYVPNTMRICPKNKKDKKNAIDKYMEGRLKATWKKQEWTSENIKRLIREHKHNILEFIRVKKVEETTYQVIQEGYSPY